jgi:hypothetical protein
VQGRAERRDQVRDHPVSASGGRRSDEIVRVLRLVGELSEEDRLPDPTVAGDDARLLVDPRPHARHDTTDTSPAGGDDDDHWDHPRAARRR